MKIVIDIQGMQTHQSRNRGVGRYIREIVKEFVKISKHHEVILIANDNYNDTEQSLLNVLGDVRIEFWKYREGANMRDLQRDRERFILSFNPDIAYMMSLQEGNHEPTVTSINKTNRSKCAWVTNLPDVIPLIFKDDLSRTRSFNWYDEKIQQTKKSDYIITVSEFSKERISELLHFDKSKIFTVTPAVNADVFNCEKMQSPINDHYILFVSGYNEHKNIERLIQAYSILPQDIKSNYKLLLIGKHLNHHLRQYLDSNNFQNVEILENVRDDELVNYYRGSSLFVFPSYAEGFGIPPLEAMACGVPTITSNAHSLPEVTDISEAMFDPYNIQQMSEMISHALIDNDFRQKLINNGLKRANHYSWKKSAKHMLQFFEQIYKQHNENRGLIMKQYEEKTFSQNGEDGIIQYIFDTIGATNKVAVEIGVSVTARDELGNYISTALENNTARLGNSNWKLFWFDIIEPYSIPNNCTFVNKFLTKDNIVECFEQLNIPKEFDILSIDIDSNDYYLRDALKGYSPRVVISEYNGCFDGSTEHIMPYDENYIWPGETDTTYGASLKSLTKQANELGYDLVYCESRGVNAFFVRRDINPFKPLTSEEAWVKLHWAP